MLTLLCSGVQLGEGFRVRQKQRLHVPIPHRNLLILSLALSLAAQERATSVALALQAGDVGWYPSASGEFVAKFREMAAVLEPGVMLDFPFIDMTKAQVLDLARRAAWQRP
jgi:7-cyano-7-deazaguanine synthase